MFDPVATLRCLVGDCKINIALAFRFMSCNIQRMEKAPHKIKTWIASEGRKIGWLATQIGVDQATLSLWINGHTCPRRENRVKLAEVTGLDVAKEEGWI